MAALQSSMYAGSATSGTKARGNVHVSVHIICFFIFSVCRKVAPKTMIKPADQAYFSVADGRWLPATTWNARESDKCNQILPIVYTILRWNQMVRFCEFLNRALYALGGKLMKFARIQHQVQLFIQY
jgi:hypothetical protein